MSPALPRDPAPNFRRPLSHPTLLFRLPLKPAPAPTGPGLQSLQPGGDNLVSVIVKLDAEPLATYRGGVPGLAPTSPEVTGAPKLDLKSPSSLAYLGHLAQVESTFEATACKRSRKLRSPIAST